MFPLRHRRVRFALHSWVMLLLCGVMGAGNVPVLSTSNAVGLRPLSSSEEAPSEESEGPGASAPLYLAHQARRARRARCKDLVTRAFDSFSTPDRELVSAWNNWAVFAPREHAMRFGLGAPLRI